MEPRTIFEQIVLSNQRINDNIVTLSQNLDDIREMIIEIHDSLMAKPLTEQPDASGTPQY